MADSWPWRVVADPDLVFRSERQGGPAATVGRRCPWALEQQEGMRLLALLHLVELLLLVMMP